VAVLDVALVDVVCVVDVGFFVVVECVVGTCLVVVVGGTLVVVVGGGFVVGGGLVVVVVLVVDVVVGFRVLVRVDLGNLIPNSL
jgi:hypothetical protein